MNRYLAPEYTEIIHQLALGIECIDLNHERGLMHPVRIDIEKKLPHSSKKIGAPYCNYQSSTQSPDSLCRHPSGRYCLLYYLGISTHIDLRIYDHCRYYVPRRLRVPLLPLEQVNQTINSHHSLRRRRPVLFPGAAYDIYGNSTGLRGRVLRDGQAMRWAFIEAVLPGTVELVGRTRCDDRGEFLLLLTPDAAPESELTRTIQVQVSVAGPATIPDQENFTRDTLWDLPLELLPDPGLIDNVSSGDSFPDGYVTALSAVRIVDFEIGRILTGIEETPFEFELP
ncbi:hypothetical protein [Desulfogranum marinum]|uniref:hypothetical protein n=1 Tax=Desulfogranum marinum TaxID=453220 RepID=UPI0029C940DB|nr:hypothetical protein [Desulfogranum marinum]